MKLCSSLGRTAMIRAQSKRSSRRSAVRRAPNSDNGHEKPEVKCAVLSYLNGVVDPRIQEILFGLLKDPDMMVRAHAASVIDIADDPKALDALIDMVRNDEEALVRKMAVQRLPVNDPKVIPVLFSVVKGDSNEAVGQIEWLLNDLGPAVVPALLFGVRNCPFPVPSEPHLRMNRRFWAGFCTRWLYVSTTYTFPSAVGAL